MIPDDVFVEVACGDNHTCDVSSKQDDQYRYHTGGKVPTLVYNHYNRSMTRHFADLNNSKGVVVVLVVCVSANHSISACVTTKAAGELFSITTKLLPARSVIQLDEKKCHQCY